MELADFLKVLYRRRNTLIVIPLITVIATMLLVRSLPDVYISHTRIATGLVDKSQQLLASTTEDQEPKIIQKFDNLIQTIQLKRIVNQVSYKLILHDLNDKKPFRAPSKDLKELNAGARTHAREVYQKKYDNREELSQWNEDEKGLLRVIQSMHYDNEAITAKLRVYRIANSDFINLDFESENPQLSAFVLNTLVDEFIRYQSSQMKVSTYRAVNYLDSLLRQKKAAMDGKMNELREYKIDNRVLNLNEQAKAIYGQIADFETKREGAEKDVIAYTAALRSIDNKFSPSDRQYLESKLADINTDIAQIKERIKMVNAQYIQSNFDPKYATRIDSLKSQLNAKIYESSDRYIYNPMNTKEGLVAQKLTMEISRELAKNSVQSIQSELKRLNEKLDMLVPNEAVIQSYESSIDVASREYLEILQKYNQTSMESGNTMQLRQIEKAVPGALQPSKKMLLVVLSGIISLVFCVFVFFVLFYFDRSLNNPRQLAAASGLPVIGHLNTLKESQLDLQHLWENESPNGSVQLYKDLLRAIRFEIESKLHESTAVAITSFIEGEGKTFLTISLAYAFSRINKKVLVIDGNFMHPDISQTINTPIYTELLFSEDQPLTLPEDDEDLITIAANSGGDFSVLEIGDRERIEEKMTELKKQFDIILIETSALRSMSKAKEWTLFADQVIAVFEAGNAINNGKKVNNAYLKSLGSKFSGFVINKVSPLEGLNKTPKTA